MNSIKRSILITRLSFSIPLVVQWIGVHLQCREHGFDPWSRNIPYAEERLSHLPCREHGSDPWSRKIPHVEERLSHLQCREHGSDPWSRKIPHAEELLSLCATTTEPDWVLQTEACARAPREATTVRSPHTATESNPHSPQLEKAHVQQWRPSTAKNK